MTNLVEIIENEAIENAELANFYYQQWQENKTMHDQRRFYEYEERVWVLCKVLNKYETKYDHYVSGGKMQRDIKI